MHAVGAGRFAWLQVRRPDDRHISLSLLYIITGVGNMLPSLLYLIIQNFSPLKFRPALSTKPFETQREGLALVVFCDLERAYNAGLRPYTFHVSVLINKVNIHAGSKNG